MSTPPLVILFHRHFRRKESERQLFLFSCFPRLFLGWFWLFMNPRRAFSRLWYPATQVITYLGLQMRPRQMNTVAQRIPGGCRVRIRVISCVSRLLAGCP